MNQKVHKHEKIRFRREDITSLTKFPSAEGQDHLLCGRSVPSKILRGFAIGCARSRRFSAARRLRRLFDRDDGLGSDRLRQEAEAAIQRFAGVDVAANVGPVNLSLDPSRFVALEVHDVKFAKPADGETMLDAGLVRFGVRFWPLMSGQVRLGSASISDARIIAAALPSRDGPDWKAALLNDEELIDPDRVVELLFGSLHRAFDTMELGSTRRIELDNVEILLPEGGRMRSVLISSAQAGPESRMANFRSRRRPSIDGRAVSIEGTASRDTLSRRISDVDLNALRAGRAGAIRGPGTRGPASCGIGGVRKPNWPVGGVRDWCRGNWRGSFPSVGERQAGSKQCSIFIRGRDRRRLGCRTARSRKARPRSRSSIFRSATGRSRFNFHGAIGPMPKTEDGRGGGSYRYELVSDGSTVSPGDSPEPALEFLARISGNYEPLNHRLTADQLGIRTNSGELLGTGSLEFARGKGAWHFSCDHRSGHVRRPC